MNIPALSLLIVRNSRVTENRNIACMAVLSLKGGHNALCFFGQLSLMSKTLCLFFYAEGLERVEQKKEKSWARRSFQTYLQPILKTAKLIRAIVKMARLKKTSVSFPSHSFGGWFQANPKKVAHPAQLQSKKKSGPLTSRMCRVYLPSESLLFLKELGLASSLSPQNG